MLVRPAWIFFESHEGPQQKHLLEIADFILAQHPAIVEECKFKTAFYIYKGWLCYLGFRKQNLIIGFVDGVHLANTEGMLRADEGQTQIRQIKIKLGDPVPYELIHNTLQEALLFKDETQKNKKLKSAKKTK